MDQYGLEQDEHSLQSMFKYGIVSEIVRSCLTRPPIRGYESGVSSIGGVGASGRVVAIVTPASVYRLFSRQRISPRLF